MSTQVSTKSLINRIKVEYINNPGKETRLKDLCAKYGVNYQVCKNQSSREKWKALRDAHIKIQEINPTDGLCEVKTVHNEIGEDILQMLTLLTTVAEEFESYFIMKDGRISVAKIKEYLQTMQLLINQVHQVWDYMDYSEREKLNVIIARLGVALGKTSDMEDNPISDNFIQSLKEFVN